MKEAQRNEHKLKERQQARKSKTRRVKKIIREKRRESYLRNVERRKENAERN